MERLAARAKHILVMIAIAVLTMAQAEISEECQKRLAVFLTPPGVVIAQGESASVLVATRNLRPGFTPTYGASLPAGATSSFDYGVSGPGNPSAAVLTITAGLDTPRNALRPGLYCRPGVRGRPS